jgi:hypothetical protein
MYTNRWVGRFKIGRTTLDDEEWSDQPSTSQLTTVLKWMDWLKNTPSDYHVFGPLKESLHGQRYASVYEVQDMVHVWLWSQPKTSFADGVERLVNCYKICAQKAVIILRNYKLYMCHIAIHEVINKFTCFLTLPHMIYVWQYSVFRID